jgi:hypothetical protein
MHKLPHAPQWLAALALLLLVSTAPAQIVWVCGDCNQDGALTILDALRGAQIAAGLIVPQPIDYQYCDVNFVSPPPAITVLDALIMAQAAAGLTVVLTCPSGCGINDPYIDADYLALQTASPPVCRELEIPFQLTDLDSDLCDITVEFSTDSGSTWDPCTEHVLGSSGTTGLASSPAGVWHTYIWDSDAPGNLDQPQLYPSVMVRMTVSNCGTPGNTDSSIPAFAVNNGNAQPAVVVSTVAPPYAVHGNVLMDYYLFDNDADPCDLVAECSTDGGATWDPAAMGPGGDGLTSLASALLGIVHSFDWDVDGSYPGTWSAIPVHLRLTPFDCAEGLSDTRIFNGGAGCLPTQTPPSTTVSTPLAGQTFAGNVTIDYTVTDADHDLVDVVWEWSVDNGFTWGGVCTPAVASPPTTALPATPTGHATQFIWNSAADIMSPPQPLCRLRLSPTDFCGAGLPEVAPPLTSGPFEIGCPVGGTTPPTVQVTTALSGGTYSGAINVDFDVVDADTHPVDVLVEYSTDDGTTWLQCTLTVANPLLGLPSSAAGLPASITWDSTADITTSEPLCRLRFSASDFCDTATPVVSPHPSLAPFIVDNGGPSFGPGYFVCNQTESRVYYVSVTSPTVIGDYVQLPAGTSPFSAAIDNANDVLYVLGENCIYMIDANTHTIIDADPGGGGLEDPISSSLMSGIPCASFSPQQMEIASDGSFLIIHVYNCGAANAFNLMKVSTSGPPYAVAWNMPQALFPDVPGEFALSPDMQRIVTCNNAGYYTDNGDPSCPQIDSMGCLSCAAPCFGLVDTQGTDSVSYIDANTGTIINSINNMGSNPLWACFKDDSSECYVTEFGFIDTCIDPITCDLLGEYVHVYDTPPSGSMSEIAAVCVPCPATGCPGSSHQEGSFPSGIMQVPGRDILYITDPANDEGKPAIFNTTTHAFESTSGEPLQFYTPQTTGILEFAPQHLAFDGVRNYGYVIELDAASNSCRVQTFYTAGGTFGAIDPTRSFGPVAGGDATTWIPLAPFGAGPLTGLVAFE